MSTTTETVEETIEESAKAPRTTSIDGLTATEHSLREQILADQYLEANKAVRKKQRGLNLAKLKPPGTV